MKNVLMSQERGADYGDVQIFMSTEKKHGKIYIYVFIYITLVRIYINLAFLILYSYYLGD